MNIRVLKYASPFIVYLSAFRAFSVTGWQVWLPLIYAWIIIPLSELLLKPDANNMNAAEEELAKADKTYNVLLYTVGQGKPVFSLKNEMIQFHLIQIAFAALIFFIFGWLVTLYFLCTAMISILYLKQSIILSITDTKKTNW